MDKQKFVTKVDVLGHKIDDGVESYSEQHGYSKWQVWLLLLAAICFAGMAIKIWG